MKVSVVVLSRNRREALLGCIERLHALPERPPVIVVDNASSDGTPRALKARFPGVKLVRVPFDMGDAARNLGVECSDTPYVAFCDVDAAWAPGALAHAEGILDLYRRIGLLAARVLRGPEGREDPRSSHLARSPLPSRGLPGRAVLAFAPGAVIFRRAAFRAAGGYEPRFAAAEEEELLAYDLAAAGWQLVYLESLVIRRASQRVPEGSAAAALRARNAMWLAWLRRPPAAAWRITWENLCGESGKAALAATLRELAWIVRNRRVVPAHVEAWCRLLN